MKLLKAVGYWYGDDDESKKYIHPKHLIDRLWHNDEKEYIIQYLKAGLTYMEYMGYSFCRFPDGPPNNQMGDRDLTDGVWVWPEGLHIYVANYNVKLPEEFYLHMKNNKFIIPNMDVSCELGYSDKFWIDWCNKQIR